MDARSEYERAMATRPQDEVITAHCRALAGLDVRQRQALLDAVRTYLLTGTRHTADQVTALARFIACAEMRHPGSLLDRVEPRLADQLRSYAVTALPVLPSRVRHRHDVADPPAARPGRAGRGWDGLESDPVYQQLIGGHAMMCVPGLAAPGPRRDLRA